MGASPWGLLLSPGVRGGLLREAVFELSDEEKAGLKGPGREHSSREQQTQRTQVRLKVAPSRRRKLTMDWLRAWTLNPGSASC